MEHYSIRLVEPNILQSTWIGTVSREDFIAGNHQRVDFARAHTSGKYVMVMDIRQAQVNFVDIQLINWSVNLDSNVAHTVIIGGNALIQMMADLVRRIAGMRVDFVTTPEDALARARAALHKRLRAG